MDRGLSPFRMELVLTEFYVARGGPVLRPSMKCTVHESRAHLNGEEGRCWWCCCCCTQRTLPSTERTSHWPIGQSRHGPKEDDRRSLVSNGSPWVDSCDDLSSLLSHSRHSSSSFLIVYELHTHIHIYVCDSPLSVSTTPSPLLSFPSFFLFFFSDHMSLFLSLSPLPSRRANLLLCLSQSYIAWSLFSFHSPLLIAKCRNILLPELFSSRSPNQLSRGGIARVVLCALSRGPCWSNWISRLARRSPPIPPIFSLCFCLSPPVLPLDTHLHQKFSYPNNIPIISFLRYVFERQILPNL